MKSSRLILASLSLLLILPATRAQLLTADDFFNDGAHSYISNNIPLALTNVETGLKFYPNDEKLQKLEKLLKQQQQQQNQDQKNQQSKNNQNSQQQNSQSQQNQSQQDQQKKDSQSQQDKDQQNQNQQNQDQKNQQQQNAQQAKADEQKAGETNGEPQKVALGQMTPEEAKRLLDQQKGNEQVLVMKPNGKPPDASHPVKDW